MNLSYEQLESLIKLATERDTVDIFIAIINIATPLLVGLFSYYAFIQSPKQLAKSKIKEKEVEMLYEAFDHFFVFSDTIGLFISNKERKYNNLLKNIKLEDSFSEKEKASSEAVYSSFSSSHLASHILRAIGDKDTESKIDIYRTEAVALRALILNFENNGNINKTIDEIEKIHNEISIKRIALDAIKDDCFDRISNFKDKLKQN